MVEGLAPLTRAVVHSHVTICRRLLIQYVFLHMCGVNQFWIIVFFAAVKPANNILFCIELIQSRGLHGGPETRGPGSRVSGHTDLLLRVPGLFNIPESIGEHRTREWSVSVSMRVFCNLQFVKLGWEKCEREIRWKKNTRYLLSRQKQSAGGVNVSTASGRWSWISSWVMWKKSWNKTEEFLNTLQF